MKLRSKKPRTSSALQKPDWRKRFRKQVEIFKNPRAALQVIRSEMSPEQTPILFADLIRSPVFRAAIAANKTPERFLDLGYGRRIKSCGLVSDVAWTGQVISAFPEIINDFLIIESSFENSWISGDFTAAKSYLNSLEDRYGLSIWLISRRIALLRTEGTNQISDYVNTLIAKDSSRTLYGWLIYMMGYRADPNVSPISFIKQIEETVSGSELSEASQAQLQYFALSSAPAGLSLNEALLGSFENLPIIDRYVSFLDVLQSVVSEESLPSGAREHILQALCAVDEKVSDERIKLLIDVLEPDGTKRIVARVAHKTVDAYTAGQYDKAAELVREDLEHNPASTNFYDLAARISLRTDTLPQFKSPIGEIVRQIASVHIFAEDDATAAVALMREAIVSAHRPLAASIRSFFSSIPSAKTSDNVAASIDSLNSRHLTPRQLCLLPVASRDILLDKAIETYPESLALKLQRQVLNFGKSEIDPLVQAELPSDRRALYSARALTHLKRYDDAIDAVRPLLQHDVDYVANDARRELFRAYQAAGDFKEALRIVAEAHRQNPKLHSLFELPSLLSQISNGPIKPPFEEISLSIVYHIANRFGGEDQTGAEADAAEEFALSVGATLPSNIDRQAARVDGDLFDIYLDQVCSPSILDKFMALETAGQVEIERLEICRILSERDSTGRQRYLDEIREITRRRVVRERFEQVERTKIYVDTDGVKRQAEKTLLDTYSRFAVALADDGEATERVQMMRKIQELLSDIDAEGVRIHFPDLPASEREIMFERLVRDFMRMLISSHEYGLEAYLSTRVRHGTMGNQLRSAFEVNSLITQRDSGIYQPDEFWPEALNLGFEPLSLWLSDRLARFSQEIDIAIEDLVRRRVQVRSENCPNGLFIFQSFNYDIIRLQSEISPDTSFDVFLDKVIDQFWRVLEVSLTAVRQYIENEFLHKIHSIIDELERDVVQELFDKNSSLLRAAIAAARTQMSISVANVANWFTLARDMERPDYDFGVAVEVATESIRVCHPSLNVQLHRRDDVSFECRGRSLESLVYLLFTAMDNAVAHSGLADMAPDIALETVLKDGWLEMTLVNSCLPAPNFEATNIELTELRARLDVEDGRQTLTVTEGGTGYAKIIRILRHDLLARFVLEFGYRSATEYAVKIAVEGKAIVK